MPLVSDSAGSSKDLPEGSYLAQAGEQVHKLAAEAWEHPVLAATVALGVAAVSAKLGMGVVAERNFARALEIVSRNTLYVEAEAGGLAPDAIYQGTGFIVSNKGHVATALHVVDGAKEITLFDKAGRHFAADVVSSDRQHDVALLKFSDRERFAQAFKGPVPTLTETPRRWGEASLSLGHQGSSAEQVRVDGVFRMERRIGKYEAQHWKKPQTIGARQISLDMPVQPGQSGAALVDRRGGIYGVVIECTENLRAANATPISRIVEMLKSAAKD